MARGKSGAETLGNAVEWPTILLIGAVYSAWLFLTSFHDLLPLPLWLIAAAIAGTLWGSLQHEMLHGHPTASCRLNTALATPPFWLWLPFERYRQTHLRHHRDERLTDPLDDPESRYWRPEDWHALSRPEQVMIRAQSTLLGRMLIGPFWSIVTFWRDEVASILSGDDKCRLLWMHHLVHVAAVLIWIIAVCDVPLWQYILGFVLLPTSITLIRSFAEHRADHSIERRTAIVENSRFLGPLFLFNNLHFAHHGEPALPWYRLPAHYRRCRDAMIAANGGLVYNGYGELFHRYLLRPHDAPLHPTGRAPMRSSTMPTGRRPDTFNEGVAAARAGAAEPQA